MFELIDLGKKLAAEILAGDFTDALRTGGDLLPRLADLIDALTGKSSPKFGSLTTGEFNVDFDPTIEALEHAVATAQAKPKAGGLDLAGAILIVQQITDLIKLIRDLRNKPKP